jgi:hypothetical protein
MKKAGLPPRSNFTAMPFTIRKAKRRYEVSTFAEKRKTNKARFELYGEFFARYVTEAMQENLKGYFVTLTTQNQLTVKATRGAMNSYIHKLTRQNDFDLRAIWCAEPFDLKEGYHLHALMCTNAPKELMKEIWREMNSTQSIDTTEKQIAAIHSGSNEKYLLQAESHGDKTKARSFFSEYNPEIKKRKSSGGGAGEYCAKYILKSMNSGDWDICDIRQYKSNRAEMSDTEILKAHARCEYMAAIPKNNPHAVYIGDKF